MGYTSCADWKKPSDIKDELITEIGRNPNVSLLAIKSTSGGRHIWMAVQRGNVRYIRLAIVDGKWPDLGYKTLSEEEGPHIYDCPMSLFKLAPHPISEYSKKWRDLVVEYDAMKDQTFEVGQTVTIYKKLYVVKSAYKGKTYLVASVETGRVYVGRPLHMRAVNG